MWSDAETTISASQVIHSNIHQLPLLGASFLARFHFELVTVSSPSYSAERGKKGTSFSLINCFPEILHILHQVDCTVGEAFCDLAMGEYANKLQDRLVLPCG